MVGDVGATGRYGYSRYLQADANRQNAAFKLVGGDRHEHPLQLVSRGMGYYATDVENCRLDVLALAELDKLNEDALFSVCRSQHISMCGMLPTVIVLKTQKELGIEVTVEDIGYATSADVTGDKTERRLRRTHSPLTELNFEFGRATSATWKSSQERVCCRPGRESSFADAGLRF